MWKGWLHLTELCVRYRNEGNPLMPEPQALNIITHPSIYLLSRPFFQEDALVKFLTDQEIDAAQDFSGSPGGGERLCEMAGRVCYMSFGRGRKNNRTYLENILASGHGSVLEHANYTLLITGVSRSLTHELVRHRAGFAYSQLSQRYVDESDCAFVLPPAISGYAELRSIWENSCHAALRDYRLLSEHLIKQYADVEDRVAARKMARQAARSVLPNCTETKIVVTANARAWRHFIEMRASQHADLEIRRLAFEVLNVLKAAAPALFQGYGVTHSPDGYPWVAPAYRKV